jgi:peptidoglycan biosynthesis protein MviN/MurJ (putative lipid II flippase)
MYYIEKLTIIAFYVSIFTTVSNLTLNILLIPKYGPVGAATATMATSIVSVIIALAILNSKTKVFFGAKTNGSENI